MPSYARTHQLTRSLSYHIYNRGNGRYEIFHEDNDYQHFLDLLARYQALFSFALYHWVIMGNHYHLLLEIQEPERISRFMAGLGRAYSHYHHRRYKTSGFLWQGRFKMQAIQKETYLVACGRYIERNPVRAGLASEASEYPFSSARFYSLGCQDGLTTENPFYQNLGDSSFKRQEAYRIFLRNFDNEEERSFARLENPQGNQEFIRRLIRINGRYLPRRRGRAQERIVS